MFIDLVRFVPIAMLSRSMRECGISFNARIKGCGEAFVVGDRRQEVPPYTLVFKSLWTLGVFAAFPRLLTIALLFIEGHVGYEGDWFTLARDMDRLPDKGSPVFDWALGRLAPTQKIDVHYGWSAEAFALLLDRLYGQYTGARLLGGDDSVSLEEAQLNKLEFIACLLEMQRGQRHLDVGCGWGGLMKYFIERFVTISHGVTISAEQAAYAREHVPFDSAEFFTVKDFEEHTPSEPYDVATVVGMVEHVPLDRHPEFFAWLSNRLCSGGRAYIQLITRDPDRVAGDRTRILKQLVFAHDLTTLEKFCRQARAAGFEIIEVEEGHGDYAFTTRHWVERMLAREDEIKALLGDDRGIRYINVVLKHHFFVKIKRRNAFFLIVKLVTCLNMPKKRKEFVQNVSLQTLENMVVRVVYKLTFVIYVNTDLVG